MRNAGITSLLVRRTRTNFGDKAADGPQTAGLDIQLFQTVAEDVFILSVGTKRRVNLFNCAFEIILLTYLLYQVENTERK